MMALRFAVNFLFLLSSGAVKSLAQQASPLKKVCTNQTKQDLIGGFSTECLSAFQLNASLLSKPSISLMCASCWWAGVGNHRSIADCISGCRKAMNIWTEKEPLGLKYTQLIRSHSTAHYQKITCVY